MSSRDAKSPSKSWTYNQFKTVCGINDKEIAAITDIVRQYLRENELLGKKFRMKRAQATLNAMISSLPLPELLKNTPRDVINHHLKQLAHYINYNIRRGYDCMSGSDIKPEPSSRTSPRPKTEPSATQRHPDTGLGLLQLTVRGLHDDNVAICNAIDIRRNDKTAENVTVKDLDHRAWIGFLEEEISFDRDSQLITFTNPTDSRTSLVKSDLSLRAVVRNALRAGHESIDFSIKSMIKRGKFSLLFCYFFFFSFPPPFAFNISFYPFLL